jgi:hypothetical protein
VCRKDDAFDHDNGKPNIIFIELLVLRIGIGSTLDYRCIDTDDNEEHVGVNEEVQGEVKLWSEIEARGSIAPSLTVPLNNTITQSPSTVPCADSQWKIHIGYYRSGRLEICCFGTSPRQDWAMANLLDSSPELEQRISQGK